MGEPSMINTGVQKRNPFPGIRPFTSAEDQYFFGREEVVLEVKTLLRENGFVALVGSSASGKTSLVQSGIIPSLLSEDDQDRVPVTIRPGLKPMESLIRGFCQVFPKKLKESDVGAYLTGRTDLGDMLVEKGLGSHRYCLVVDQFEELFRTGPGESEFGKQREADRFVEQLVRLIKRERPAVDVICAVRSDFMDACTSFRSLTELLNRSKYLLPQMTEDALTRAIIEPIRKAGVSVEPGFLDALLKDLEEVEVPLPQLQHALMRTWEYWARQGNRDAPITVADYRNTGSVGSALHHNLEEAYEELNESQKLICERLFKRITSKSDQFDGFQRRATLGTVARIAQCSLEDLVDVVETFRKPDRAFLSLHPPTALEADTVVELSHESLIVLWDRLKRWVSEEAESRKMYLRLSEASALYQQGRTELWRPPDLQLALQWKETHKPTPAWGVQYDPAFERAMVFLSTSEEEYLWEEERKVVLQRRRLILNRAVAVFMGVLVIVLAVIFYTTRRGSPGEGSAEQTAGQEVAGTTDDIGSTGADRENVPSGVSGERNGTDGEDLPVADPQSDGADEMQQTEEGDRSAPGGSRPGETVAGETGEREPQALERAGESSRNTEDSPVTGTGSTGTTGTRDGERDSEAGGAAFRQRAISIARDVAGRSTGITRNPDLQGLLAYQAYKINEAYNGTENDPEIYGALYQAMKKLISPAYNIYPNIRNSVKAIEWLNRTGSILTVSSDGSVKILSGTYANIKSQINLNNTGLNNECLAVSPNERLAAVGTNGGGLLFLELENRGRVVHRNTEEGDIVLFLENLGNTGSFISAGTDNRIIRWRYTGFSHTELVSAPARPSALAASRNGSSVAFATRDGKLYELDTENPSSLREIADFGRNHIRALVFSPGGQYLAAGLLDGTVRVLGGRGRAAIATLRGPSARVSDLAYSPNGRYLAAASHDGNVYLWNATDWSVSPLVFTENNGFVLSVCFSGNSNHIYSGSVDFPRLVVRPTHAFQMAGEICSLIGRNLSQAEWDQYFGGDIPYEKTCPGKD